ncbi:hypothetical protein EPICR_80002 [Candidatus Desulfarcum epimagneticum]|uniref:TIR domain-containing protein n=1 Tax=uncultured Desulfobacteraceae bacterium TaxID=218296 RepID=A0A484HJ59_9BACT|nr:hypothetical protein EPICR_80002 [uncultured Desulfobacteraceae bacterium]
MVQGLSRASAPDRPRREKNKIGEKQNGEKTPMPHHDIQDEYDVFISYAVEDRGFAAKLSDLLLQNGVRVWFDEREIRPGDHVSKKINDGIAKSRKMIAVWSRNYWGEEKTWTLLETFAATSGDPLSKDRPLIPLLIDHSQKDIPPLYRSLKVLYFRRKNDFDLHFSDVLNALDLGQGPGLEKPGV